MKRNLAPVRALPRELTVIAGSFAPASGSLPYDGQSGNFTPGLVVTGGTSMATGLIAGDTDAGATGTLVLTGVVGTFVDNEAITDSSTGAAVVNGSLTAAAANAPTALKGLGFTVAWTSAGLWTVTLGDGLQANEIVHAKAMLQLKTGADRFVEIGTMSASARTIEIRVWDVSAAAVVDLGVADADNRIHFVVFLRNTAAPLTRG